MHLPIGIPPVAKAVAGEGAGIMAGSQVEVADISALIVEAMRDDDAFGEAVEIVVIGLQLFPGVEPPLPIEVPQTFFLLG